MKFRVTPLGVIECTLLADEKDLNYVFSTSSTLAEIG